MNGKHLHGRFRLFTSDRFPGSAGGGRGSHHNRHGGGGMRGGGLRIGRMLSAADLHLLVLALLEDRPRHGYDIIKAIQELTGGVYMPSPGMIYPALSYLEESGQVASQPDGAKKQYRLIEPGLAVLNDNRARISTLFDELRRVGQRLGNAREAYERSVHDPDASAASPAATLETVRRDLKSALFDSLDAPAEEQQRIVGILQRTIAEIRKR